MTTRTVTFPSALGHELSARLELPADGRPVACALFAHCFTGSKDLSAAVTIARSLAAERIAILRIDFTGLDDLVAAARFMEQTLQPPSILVGHSLGGAAVLHAAGRLPSVRAVATIGAQADLEQGRLQQAVQTLGRALLIFHSPVDQVVGIENAARLYGAARHPKSFVSLDRADHLLTDPTESRYLAAVLAAWAHKYIDLPPEEPPSEVVKHDRVVTTTPGDAFRTDIMAGGHAMVADEPRSVGGTNTGPTPYDLVGAGLGACTGMTLRMYADRKGWPLEEVVVHIKHEKIYSEDEARCEGDSARLDRLTRTLEIKGPLDDAQRARLLEIAHRCPVHQTLEAGVQMVTELDEPAPAATSDAAPSEGDAT